LATGAGRAIGVASAIAADRAAASATGADPGAAATTPFKAWAAVAPRNAISTVVARATSRWRAAAEAVAAARGRAAEAVAVARGRAAAAVVVRGGAVGAAAAVAVAVAGAKGATMRTGTGQRLARNAGATYLWALLGVAVGTLIAWTPAALAQQKTFASPEAAMNAFGEAIATTDDAAVKALLGADYRKFIPPAGAEVRYRFLAAWAKSHAIKPDGEGRALVAVGNDGWTLPIPLVKTAQGWQFDTRAGAEEMRLRRIGRNELAVMQVMLAIYDAEKEYGRADRNGDGVLQYAARFASSPGKRDGLYWPTKSGEAPSPLGPAVAAARAAGGGEEAGYYGYRYKLLTGQGKNAPGGAFDYFAGGRMIGGFAAVAWPVRYGDTGVMTFTVSHDGVVYEKDLGPDTAARAAAMTRFDPDSTWQKAAPGS
jgi:hypothetical protein